MKGGGDDTEGALDLLEAIKAGLMAKGVDPNAALRRALLPSTEMSDSSPAKSEQRRGESSDDAEEVTTTSDEAEEESSEEGDSEEHSEGQEGSTADSEEESGSGTEDSGSESESGSESGSSDEDEVRVKFALGNGEVRAARLPMEMTLKKLRKQIRKDYGAQKMLISYKDSEGDQVAIRTQKDLRLALRLQGKLEEADTSCPSLRLTLTSEQEKCRQKHSPAFGRPPPALKSRSGRLRPRSSGLGVGAVRSPGRAQVAEAFGKMGTIDLEMVEETKPSEFSVDFRAESSLGFSTMDRSYKSSHRALTPNTAMRSRLSKTSALNQGTDHSSPERRPLTAMSHFSTEEKKFGGRFSTTTLVQPYAFLDASTDGEDKGAGGEGGGALLWQRGHCIGAGSFGKVYAALDLRSGRQLAVKQIDTRGAGPAAAALRKEIALLEGLAHPNIVMYLGTQQAGRRLNVFLEYASEGSLLETLRRFGPLREGVVRQYAAQLLAGLAYLHGRGIIHRDIKPSNILMDKGILKLADFGCSVGVQLKDGGGSEAGHQYTAVGTTVYMAPEVMQADAEAGTGYGRRADVWSLGMTALEMATGRAPFPSAPVAIYKVCVRGEVPPAPPSLSPEGRAFLARCLAFDPAARADAAELLAADFCTVLDAPELLREPEVGPGATYRRRGSSSSDEDGEDGDGEAGSAGEGSSAAAAPAGEGTAEDDRRGSPSAAAAAAAAGGPLRGAEAGGPGQSPREGGERPGGRGLQGNPSLATFCEEEKGAASPAGAGAGGYESTCYEDDFSSDEESKQQGGPATAVPPDSDLTPQATHAKLPGVPLPPQRPQPRLDSSIRESIHLADGSSEELALSFLQEGGEVQRAVVGLGPGAGASGGGPRGSMAAGRARRRSCSRSRRGSQGSARSTSRLGDSCKLDDESGGSFAGILGEDDDELEDTFSDVETSFRKWFGYDTGNSYAFNLMLELYLATELKAATMVCCVIAHIDSVGPSVSCEQLVRLWGCLCWLLGPLRDEDEDEEQGGGEGEGGERRWAAGTGTSRAARPPAAHYLPALAAARRCALRRGWLVSQPKKSNNAEREAGGNKCSSSSNNRVSSDPETYSTGGAGPFCPLRLRQARRRWERRRAAAAAVAIPVSSSQRGGGLPAPLPIFDALKAYSFGHAGNLGGGLSGGSGLAQSDQACYPGVLGVTNFPQLPPVWTKDARSKTMEGALEVWMQERLIQGSECYSKYIYTGGLNQTLNEFDGIDNLDEGDENKDLSEDEEGGHNLNSEPGTSTEHLRSSGQGQHGPGGLSWELLGKSYSFPQHVINIYTYGFEKLAQSVSLNDVQWLWDDGIKKQEVDRHPTCLVNTEDTEKSSYETDKEQLASAPLVHWALKATVARHLMGSSNLFSAEAVLLIHRTDHDQDSGAMLAKQILGERYGCFSTWKAFSLVSENAV